MLLCVAMLLSLAACGGSETPAPTDAVAAPTAAPTDAPTEAPTVAPVQTAVPDIIQLVDNDDVAVHITKIEHNEHLGMQLRIQCVNKTDRALMYSWDMVSVCGFMYDPFWAEEVGPGKTSNSTIDFDTYALEKMGILSMDEISFTLRVYDSENWMDEPLVEDIFTIYPTGLNAETFALPDHVFSESHVVVADDENVRFVIEGVTGKGGGYRLTKDPAEYRVGDILRLTEGELVPVACMECGAEPCGREADCRTRSLWHGFHQVMNDYFDNVTLADLMRNGPQ